MKHPSEWRYSDEAFHEVKARIGGNSWADSKTHQVFEDQGAGVYRNMGWFQLTYFPYGGGVWPTPAARYCGRRGLQKYTEAMRNWRQWSASTPYASWWSGAKWWGQ